ncbi:MAG: MFS transporter [Minwuia sp.]|uniref:MFS transporter n=1 Tax=Minwuia sp. TaxID=2493630 RepID=UPI003A8C6CE9
MRRNRLYAAGVLFFCFLLGMTGRGLFDSFVVMLRPLDLSHDWSRDELTAIYAIAMVCWGLGAPLAGVIFDRGGARPVYLLGITFAAGGLLLASTDWGLWSFYLGHGIAVGTSTALLGTVTHAALVSRWFDRSRATALGLVHSSMGIGVLLFSPVTQLLIDAFGWQGAYRGLTVIGLAVVLPIAILAPWNRFMEGHPDIRAAVAAAPGAIRYRSLAEAVRGWRFWAMCWIYAITGMGIYVAVTQLVDYFQVLGVPALEAASIYGVAGALAPAGMIAFGIIADRLGMWRAATLSYGLTLLAYGGFLLLPEHFSKALLYGSAVCLGLTLGSRGPMVSTMVSRTFQGPAFGRIYGAILAFGGLGGGIGAWIGGFIHEAAGGHAALFWVGGVVLVAAGAPFVFLSRWPPR